WAKKWPRTVTTAASPTAISSDCLAARDASWGSPAPVKRATSTVVPTVTAESAAMTRNMIWSAEPVPAIATAPSVPTIARTTTPSIVWNRFSAMIGMARPLTERTRWCSSRAKVFGRGRGGGRSGGAGASFRIVAIRAILADRGIVRRGRAGPGPRVVARRVPADPAHAGALGDAAAAAPQPDRHDRRRAADRAVDAGGAAGRRRIRPARRARRPARAARRSHRGGADTRERRRDVDRRRRRAPAPGHLQTAPRRALERRAAGHGAGRRLH